MPNPGCRSFAARRTWTISTPAPSSPFRYPPAQLKWHYQAVPNDNWDYDTVQQLMLADLTINGRPRKVLMQAPKNGFFYVLDRVTGAVHFRDAVRAGQLGEGLRRSRAGRWSIRKRSMARSRSRFIPTAGGAHNWSPMSFNPATGLVYIPTTYGNWTFAAGDEVIAAPTGHTGLAPGVLAPRPNRHADDRSGASGKERGVLQAWDPVNQKLVWRTPGGGGIGGGTVTTAGNLVFQVINDGRLLAYSADKGEKLFELQTGRTGMGAPITYEVDGKQYVALMGGLGRPACRRAGRTMRRWIHPPLLFVFELDGKTPMPGRAAASVWSTTASAPPT